MKRMTSTTCDDNLSNLIIKKCKLDFNGRQPILVRKESDTTNKVIKKSNNMILWFITAAFVLFISIYDRYSYNRTINTQEIVKELNTLVINQNEALLQIENVLESIKRKNDYTYLKVMNFIGTTGVGKTFCVNIIERGFKPKQVHRLNLKDLKEVDLSKYIPYLLIFEDLNYSDINDLVLFLHGLPKDKVILVINIFNPQETKDLRTYTVLEKLYYEIPASFKEKSNLPVYSLIFKQFNKQIIEDNIAKIQWQFGVDVDRERWSSAVNVHDFKIFGLKGFFQRLNVKL